jgi:hypothetical protein
VLRIPYPASAHLLPSIPLALQKLGSDPKLDQSHTTTLPIIGMRSLSEVTGRQDALAITPACKEASMARRTCESIEDLNQDARSPR